MAVDTRRKRASVVSVGRPWLRPAIVPDGTLGQADRQTVANGYYGILAAGVEPPPPLYNPVTATRRFLATATTDARQPVRATLRGVTATANRED